jgi:hypothetical protein
MPAKKSPAPLGEFAGVIFMPARDCRAKRFQAEFDENQTMRATLSAREHCGNREKVLER